MYSFFSQTLGNNITYSYYPFGVTGIRFSSTDSAFIWTYDETGIFDFSVKAENKLSVTDKFITIIVQDEISGIHLFQNDNEILGNYGSIELATLVQFVVEPETGTEIEYFWNFPAELVPTSNFILGAKKPSPITFAEED